MMVVQVIVPAAAADPPDFAAHLGRATILDLYASRSDDAVASATGFRSRQPEARVLRVLGRE